jgi:ribosome-associated protein
MLDISEVSAVADYFVICSGTSERQLGALQNQVRTEVKEAGAGVPLQVEGTSASGWILMDYGAVVVHLFTPELRIFYDLEDLWRSGRTVVRMQ